MFDKLKGLLRGRRSEAKQGIDQASDVVTRTVGEQHAAKVDDVADTAKDAVDKLAGP